MILDLDQETWKLVALGLGGLFILLAIGGILVLVIANKKKVDASPALPSINRKAEEDVEAEVPFADTEFTTTKASSEAVAPPTPLSRRALRGQGSDAKTSAPRAPAARSFFADDDDDDFDFTSGRD